MVLARLEQADGKVVHRFVLEDFDVFGDDGAEESSPGTGRRANRRSARGRRRRVSLPTTYAALLEEATSPRISPGIAARYFYWEKVVIASYPGAVLETPNTRFSVGTIQEFGGDSAHMCYNSFFQRARPTRQRSSLCSCCCVHRVLAAYCCRLYFCLN